MITTIFSGILSLVFGFEGCFADDICLNDQSVIYCSSGCCGSYNDHHCCSHTGLIVGIVVCVGVITGIVVIYCYLRHRNRKRMNPRILINEPCPRNIATVQQTARTRGCPIGYAEPALPGYPPPYEHPVDHPPLQPKGPPPAYESVYANAAGIGGATVNNSYPPPVS